MKVPFLPRDVLANALNGDPRVVRAFQDQYAQVQSTAAQASSTAETAGAIANGSVLTTSPNDAFPNERVVKAGDGIALEDDGTYLLIRIDNTGAAAVVGGFGVTLHAMGATDLVLPMSGTLATRQNAETLSSKTLDKPSLSNLGNYANDAAAAAGGVPVGGVYHNAGALRVRLT